jgi:hypothetical protein
MKKLILVLIIGLAFQNCKQTSAQMKADGQQFYSELYGFKLGQYRDAAKKELGNPIKYGKFEDGFIYEAFLLKPDSSLHIVFEYAARDTNLIWSIQVSGKNNSTDIGFRNIKMGIDKAQTEEFLGKPSSIEDIGEYGQRWVYDKTNFSVEVNTKGKLLSVKILNNSNELFPKQDLEKLPTFEKIQKALNTGTNNEILDLLCGDIEIYHQDKTYSFQKSFKTEENTDYSKILSLLRKISNDLTTVNTKNDKEYIESIRIVEGEDSKHVMKFRNGHTIKEIVFKYYGGRYLIYEISAN